MCNFVPLPHLSQWGVVKNLLKIVETESLLLWDPEPIKNGPALQNWFCCEIRAGTYIVYNCNIFSTFISGQQCAQMFILERLREESLSAFGF